MKTDLFQSCGHCWVFQICWHIECSSTFTASSFRILISSIGIPSPLLALSIVMLYKTHLTLHSRMSGSRWVTIPSWLSGSLWPFLYSSSVYSCHLFLIPSASVRSLQFLSLIEPIFAWNVVSDSVQPHRWQPNRLPHPWDSPGKNTGVGCHFLFQFMKVKSESEVAQSCPTVCDHMDWNLPGCSVHGIFQARVLEWGAIAFSGNVPLVSLIFLKSSQSFPFYVFL